jgi:hypothetical protein
MAPVPADDRVPHPFVRNPGRAALPTGRRSEKPPLPGSLKDNPMLSAWLRINSDETVADDRQGLGQGAVTALSQICADELGVNFERLKVISGDTFVTPNQGTTAGSQSMPNGGPAVHQAAPRRDPSVLPRLPASRRGQRSTTASSPPPTARPRPTGSWSPAVQFEKEAPASPPSGPRRTTNIGKSHPRIDIPAKMVAASLQRCILKASSTARRAAADLQGEADRH